MFYVQKVIQINIKKMFIINLEKINLKKINLFFMLVKIKDNKILSNGGRVLNVVTRSNDFKSARENIIKNLMK